MGPVKGLGPIRGPTKKKNFRSKHKHKHKSKHSHNHYHRNHRHRFQIYIFHFKITIQTQISDLWFSFFPFKNDKHKHKHKFTWMRRTEPRKKVETVRDRGWWGRNGVETWEKWERWGRNCLLPFLNLSERWGQYFHLSETRVLLTLVWWVHDVHHAIHTACGRACEIADAERWRDERQWMRELKRWEAWEAEMRRGIESLGF